MIDPATPGMQRSGVKGAKNQPAIEILKVRSRTALSFEHPGSLNFPCFCYMATKSPWSTLSVTKEMVEQTGPLFGVGIEGAFFPSAAAASPLRVKSVKA